MIQSKVIGLFGPKKKVFNFEIKHRKLENTELCSGVFSLNSRPLIFISNGILTKQLVESQNFTDFPKELV